MVGFHHLVFLEVIDGDWKDAVKTALKKPPPKPEPNDDDDQSDDSPADEKPTDPS